MLDPTYLSYFFSRWNRKHTYFFFWPYGYLKNLFFFAVFDKKLKKLKKMKKKQKLKALKGQTDKGNDPKWATSRENLSLGFATRVDSNWPAQLQRQASVLKFRL